MRSFSPGDVAEAYCANCGDWHADLVAGRANPGPLRPASELAAIDWTLRLGDPRAHLGDLLRQLLPPRAYAAWERGAVRVRP